MTTKGDHDNQNSTKNTQTNEPKQITQQANQSSVTSYHTRPENDQAAKPTGCCGFGQGIFTIKDTQKQ